MLTPLDLPSYCVCKCILNTHTSYRLFVVYSWASLSVFFFSHRNLGKSGLRVSCLGLGELVWRQTYSSVSIPQTIQTSLSPLSFRHLGDIWITDLWWGENSVVSRSYSLCGKRFALWAHSQSNNLTCVFNYRNVSKSLQSALHRQFPGNWNLSIISVAQFHNFCVPPDGWEPDGHSLWERSEPVWHSRGVRFWKVRLHFFFQALIQTFATFHSCRMLFHEYF